MAMKPVYQISVLQPQSEEGDSDDHDDDTMVVSATTTDSESVNEAERRAAFVAYRDLIGDGKFEPLPSGTNKREEKETKEHDEDFNYSYNVKWSDEGDHLLISIPGKHGKIIKETNVFNKKFHNHLIENMQWTETAITKLIECILTRKHTYLLEINSETGEIKTFDGKRFV